MSEEVTEAKLYDLLQQHFGIGTHDDVLTSRYDGEPWFKKRMIEIGKLKRLLRSRHVTVGTMLEVAEYAHAQHLPITATWELIEAIPEARRAAWEAAQPRPLSERLQEATEAALAAGERHWATRLSTSSSLDALEAWEAYCGHEHTFTPMADGRLDGKVLWRNQCSCGARQHPEMAGGARG